MGWFSENPRQLWTLLAFLAGALCHYILQQLIPVLTSLLGRLQPEPWLCAHCGYEALGVSSCQKASSFRAVKAGAQMLC